MDKKIDRTTKSEKQSSREKDSNFVRGLIRNQFGIIHHTENQIANYAKIAAILLGLASLFGLPQTLEDPGNMLMAGAASSLVLLSVICVIVIVYALPNIGGWYVKYKMSPAMSLWWYTDERLDNITRKKNADSIVDKVTEDILKKIECQNEEIEFEREAATLVLLYARTQDQTKICRRIRYVLLTGILMSFGFFLGVMTATIENELVRFIMTIAVPIIFVILGVIWLAYYFIKRS